MTEEQLPQDHHANAICCGFSRGTSIPELAKRHDVSEQLIRDVLSGKRYGQITGRNLNAVRSTAVVGSPAWPTL